jgi:hypothetical protein
MFNLNPLTVLGARTLSWIPPHFVKIPVTIAVWDANENMKNWIEQKLVGRFSIVSSPHVDNATGKLKISTFVGFEDEKELTYFMLACPHIRS